MARPLEELEATAPDHPMGVIGMVRRHESVPPAPDDEDGHRLGEVETVDGAHRLTAHPDDRAHRRKESGAPDAVGQKPVSVGDLDQIGAERPAGPLKRRSQEARARIGGAVAAMKGPAPGSVAARSSGLTSGPSPPLETSTSRSRISGNW